MRATVEAAGFTAVAVIGVAFAVINVRSFRLPDDLSALAGLVLAATLIVAAIFESSWPRLLLSLLGGLELAWAYLLLACARPGQLGIGDVKLALILVAVLEWFGWPFVIIGGYADFLGSGVAGASSSPCGRLPWAATCYSRHSYFWALQWCC